jgi:methionine-gamma-lyase
MPPHPLLLTASSLRKTNNAGDAPQTARQAMVKPFPSKTHIGNHMLHPETLMLNLRESRESSQ